MFDIIDLTRPLDENLSIYTSGDYSDPPLQVEPWCTIAEQGYKVSRLSMGTQTGTHIDAPAHFDPDGATLEVLPLQALIGPYHWVDLDHATTSDVSALSSGYRGETILFLASSSSGEVEISPGVFAALMVLPCRVWVIVVGVRVTGQSEFHFNQALARAGKYLIEDVDEKTARQVHPGGELIALPLRLNGVSGSPCRVVVKQK